MQEKDRQCCEKHVDMAFDEFLVENETFPYLENSENGKCCYCSEVAKYTLRKIEDTKEN